MTPRDRLVASKELSQASGEWRRAWSIRDGERRSDLHPEPGTLARMNREGGQQRTSGELGEAECACRHGDPSLQERWFRISSPRGIDQKHACLPVGQRITNLLHAPRGRPHVAADHDVGPVGPGATDRDNR
jgi:hypothetical protein